MQVMMDLKIIVSIVLKDIQPLVQQTHPQITVQVRICELCYYWWLVRVTLVVDKCFFAQNFGDVVGTYEGWLPLSECR